MMKVYSAFILVFVLWAYGSVAEADDKSGSVCLGPNLSVVLHDRDHVTIAVGEITGIRFSKDNSAKVVASGLDRSKIYPVTIYYDGEKVELWTLDFKKLGSKMALIWRAKGGYKTISAPRNKCTWPPK